MAPSAPSAQGPLTTSAQTPRELGQRSRVSHARHSPACRPHCTPTLRRFSMAFFKNLCSELVLTVPLRSAAFLGADRQGHRHFVTPGPACRVASREGGPRGCSL